MLTVVLNLPRVCRSILNVILIHFVYEKVETKILIKIFFKTEKKEQRIMKKNSFVIFERHLLAIEKNVVHENIVIQLEM